MPPPPLLTTSLGVCAGVLASLLSGGSAAAQGAPAGADTALQVTIGKALLEEGKASLREGRFAEARDKLEASLRSDPTPEALLALAVCQEKLGATASAWGTYHRAEQQARTLGDAARAEQAAKGAAALEPRLSRMKVVVTPGAPEPEVTLDGRWPLAKSAWGVPLPVDPGKHEVKATAPGKVRFSTPIEISGEGVTYEVLVPLLAPQGLPRPASSYPPGGASASHLDPAVIALRQRWQRMETAGIAMLVIGGSAVLTAGILYFPARSANGAAAERLTISAASLLAGGCLVGAVGFILARSASDNLRISGAPPSVGLRPFVAGSGGGLSLQGAF